MKTCSKCGVSKPLFDFFKQKTGKDGYHASCKVCFNTSTRQAKYIKRYGLTSEQIAEMKKNGCELCRATENLHIDHNHETGVIRGVLCTNCNRGIGHLKDSPDLLRKAAAYLESKGNYSKWQS